MPYLETIYDYEIKKECFKVCMEKGYVKSTDMVVNMRDVSSNLMQYALQEVSIDVVGDRGEGYITVYDNDVPIPFLVDGVRYNRIDRSQEDNVVDLQLELTYAVNHSIQVKYSGNRECMPCMSQKIPIYIEYPESSTTTLVLSTNNPDNVFTHEDTILINGLLTDNTNSPIPEAKIKLYLEDTQLTTITTNNSGEFTYELSIYDNGLYTIHAEYMGDVGKGHFYSDDLVNVSKGYVLTANTDKFWGLPVLHGMEGIPDDSVYYGESIQVTVNDYFGNPIPNCSVSCYVDTDYYYNWTGSTNDEGYCSLYDDTDYTNIRLLNNLQVSSEYGDVSNTMEVTHVKMNSIKTNPITSLRIDMNGRGIIPYGKSVPFEIQANAVDKYTDEPISLEGMTVFWAEYPSPAPAIPTLDSSGYNSDGKCIGNGSGYMNMGGTVFNYTVNYPVNKVLQYWEAGYGLNYVDYTEKDCKVYGLSNGWRIDVSKDKIGYLTLGDDSVGFNDDFCIYFEVVSSNITGFGVTSTHNGLDVGYSPFLINFKQNDKVMITREGYDLSIKVNNTQVYHGGWINPDTPALMFSSSTNSSITINKLQFYKLPKKQPDGGV